jgi:hypothetical protein
MKEVEYQRRRKRTPLFTLVLTTQQSKTINSKIVYFKRNRKKKASSAQNSPLYFNSEISNGVERNELSSIGNPSSRESKK